MIDQVISTHWSPFVVQPLSPEGETAKRSVQLKLWHFQHCVFHCRTGIRASSSETVVRIVGIAPSSKALSSEIKKLTYR